MMQFPILISFVSAQFIWQWKQLQKSKNKVSRQQKKLTASVNVLNVVMTKLAEELGREPNLSEIAAKMQMSEDEVQAVMKEAINAVAVDRSEAAQKEDEALENQ